MKENRYYLRKFYLTAGAEDVLIKVVLVENNGSMPKRVSEEISGTNEFDVTFRCIDNAVGMNPKIVSHTIVGGRALIWIDINGVYCSGEYTDNFELRASANAYIDAINNFLKVNSVY